MKEHRRVYPRWDHRCRSSRTLRGTHRRRSQRLAHCLLAFVGRLLACGCDRAPLGTKLVVNSFDRRERRRRSVAPGMRVNRRTASGAVRTREAAKACSRAEMRRSSAAPLRRAEAAWKAVLQEVEGVDVDDSCGLRDLLGVGVGDSTVEEFGEQSAFRGFEEELEAMLAFEASKRSGGGTEDADTFAIERSEVLGELAGPANGFVETGVANNDVGKCGKRRIGHDAAEVELALEKGRVVLVNGVLHGVVLWVVGLNQHAAGEIAAAGAAGDLREELEGALGGTKVGHGERRVCTDDTDECDAMEVVALGEHLRADEEVECAG